MIQVVKGALLILVVAAATSAHAQIYTLKGASISFGATGQFTTPLTTNPRTGSYAVSTPAGGVIDSTISGQQQFTTGSVGFLTSIQLHPRPWAGVEVNYGFTHFSERYAFNTSSATAQETIGVKQDMHELTSAYVFHPRHIPFQPFVNVGGGAVDFAPTSASNQWRGAGLVETGFDIPSGSKHLAFRVEGRALIYRAPNFYTPAISTGSWRVTDEPTVSAVYRF